MRAWAAALLVVIGVLVIALAVELSRGTPARVSAQDLTEGTTPAVVVSGLVTEQGIRYSITVPRPDGLPHQTVALRCELGGRSTLLL